MAQVLLLLFWASPVRAHMLADLHVHGQVEGKTLRANMRLGLHELQQWLPLPRDKKGHIVIRDLSLVRPRLRDYLKQRLRISVGDPAQDCAFFLDDFLVDDLSSLRLALRYQCPLEPGKISISSGLFVGSDHAYEMSWELRKGDKMVELELDRRHNRATADIDQLALKKTRGMIVLVSALGLLLLFAALALWIYWRKEPEIPRDPVKENVADR